MEKASVTPHRHSSIQFSFPTDLVIWEEGGERERKSDRESERKRESERERVRERESERERE